MTQRESRLKSGRPTITDLRPLPSNPTVYSIRVDGRVVARLRDNDVRELKLEAGMRWTDALRTAVESAIELQRVRADAFKYLSRAAYSRGALARKLEERGHTSISIALALDELTADGWLDDAAAARAIGEAAMRRGPAGRAALTHSMQARGIDPLTAAHTAHELLSGRDAFTDALAVAREKLQTIPARDVRTRARRVAGALARRGYDEEIVEATLARLGLLVENE